MKKGEGKGRVVSIQWNEREGEKSAKTSDLKWNAKLKPKLGRRMGLESHVS